MYILSAQDIMKGSSAGLGNECGTPAGDRFEDLQRTIRTRVEEALGVDTLDRVECRDTFQITGSYAQLCNLRLANGFLTPDAIAFHSVDDEVLDVTGWLVERRYGLIQVKLSPGTYKVLYKSGFAVEDGTDVYLGLPDWVKSIALSVMFMWRRSMNISASSKTASHYDLTSSIRRELMARIYERYDRPRTFQEFHLIGERRAVGSTEGWNQW